MYDQNKNKIKEYGPSQGMIVVWLMLIIILGCALKGFLTGFQF